MATRVHWVPYGPPAALALVKAISSAKRDDLLAPVNVVIPSNHVGVTARRLLGSEEFGKVAQRGSGIAVVTFLTVYRMAELLGAAALAQAGRRPVSTPVIAVALRAVLTENSGIVSAVAGHPATEAALVAAYRELRDLSPDALTRLAATSERAAEVVRIHRAARARLEATYYEEDLLDAAVLALDSDRVPDAFDVGPELLVSVAKERLFFDSEPLIFGNPGGMVLALVRQGFQRLEACSVTP